MLNVVQVVVALVGVPWGHDHNIAPLVREGIVNKVHIFSQEGKGHRLWAIVYGGCHDIQRVGAALRWSKLGQKVVKQVYGDR